VGGRRHEDAQEDVMADEDLFGRVSALTDEEHALRRRESDGEATDGDRQRLADIEVQLDQCWDLLRQRRARREFGQDEREAHVRDASTVEGYQQ
jgi:hypothetical protein